MTGVSTYEEDASACLNNCEWTMFNECPDFCSQHNHNTKRGKAFERKRKAVRLLLKGKSESLTASITNTDIATIRRWANEINKLMEES